ncbi:uncharacterized protein F5891DRAFT_1197321 [Suillus fuscotomentosus]|uniref:CSD2 domain-containing protein n=1 Tax=Suillus fuscotomentosus TaxID=1912939 RepID=A0AAD4DTA5_9AGAM|nr:uncharacterized protein F5891DRAFT_1197304 [Suillus fuscotomentosus]XP_041218335.1 uncharacterized protein F5891DRAFT_1197311 [Suillus fuscotomentosus]XP_041218344.1 uncharacterized protein F5891DRAFT_1197321 [Suillus fuscotomentosus]KAG1891853.1 hypothetical protein F5891DRAFT_1197304 [Suillus fuscotomentosus]KAG1891859.1 hypothetical protein F5891DRAFT_1197311 [Suillus fuscotomentosus]KAG1891868.1 hypothetical protein F5891DRAFT_1197321 [Suillus fuscotomentosus]
MFGARRRTGFNVRLSTRKTKPEGDLTGITAEQIALQNHIEALQPSAAATSFVPAAARFEPGPLAANSRIGPKQAQARPKPITNRHGWKLSSLHPFGTLAEELGPIGDIEVETSALLKDCNFPTGEFSDGVLKCLLPTPWTVPEREFEARKDLREKAHLYY